MEQLDEIDEYQCNIETFCDTYRDAAQSRPPAPPENDTDGQAYCFACNCDVTEEEKEQDDSKGSLRSRLGRVLPVSLDEDAAPGPIHLCKVCEGALSRIEHQLNIMSDFACRYRSTHVIYDEEDDVDGDVGGEDPEGDNVGEGGEEEGEGEGEGDVEIMGSSVPQQTPEKMVERGDGGGRRQSGRRKPRVLGGGVEVAGGVS